MKLDRVTITGADNGTDFAMMKQLSLDHPYVEWGILVSQKQQGTDRFPSMQWIHQLVSRCMGLRLSLHVCGKWVRDLFAGDERELVETVPGLGIGAFQRLQINTHGEKHELGKGGIDAMRDCLERLDVEQILIQIDGANPILNPTAVPKEGLVAEGDFRQRYVGFHDLSHGAGITPKEWPRRNGRDVPGAQGREPYVGYSGGLGPDNLKAELPRIAAAAGRRRIWIDMETKVERTAIFSRRVEGARGPPDRPTLHPLGHAEANSCDQGASARQGTGLDARRMSSHTAGNRQDGLWHAGEDLDDVADTGQ